MAIEDFKEEFDQHLKTDHRSGTVSEYLKEIVYGGNDGIITTFAVIAGFAGANNQDAGSIALWTVLLFGLANLLADGTSMGLGDFLSVRSQKEVYKKSKNKELAEIKNNPEFEKKETTYLLKQKGFNDEDAKKITELYSKNEKYWVEFMMNHELEIPNPESENALRNAVATFISFVTFGSIPLIPFVVFQDASLAFNYSIVATVLALIILGFVRGYTTKENKLKSVLEIVFVGGIAGSVAFSVGYLFR